MAKRRTSAPQMTRQLAYAVGRDAGNRSMRKAGRASWSEDDFNAASDATARALQLVVERQTVGRRCDA